jgi:serine/threonine protein kinase
MTTILPTFEFKELLLGKFLGRGGFCEVHEVVIKQQSRLFIAQHCLFWPESSFSGREARYALKRPLTANGNKNVQNDGDKKKEDLYQQQQAIQDLVSETLFLRQVQHPHIIKLRGVSVDVATAAAAATRVRCNEGDDGARLHPSSLPLSTTTAGSSSYFLVLDRLHDTLRTRIHSQWKPRLEQEYKKHVVALRRQQLLSLLAPLRPVRNGSTTDNANKASSRSETVFLRERLQVALDLSAALEYLHCQHIWHRDVKPQNLGFDIRGHVKIFDFGLAKKQPLSKSNRADYDDDDDSSSALFLATKLAGTLRYMAPEVGLGQRYNAKCDSYSFVHVLWEMVTCQKPYLVEFQDICQSKITFKNFKRSVWIGKTRPPLAPPSSSSPTLQPPKEGAAGGCSKTNMMKKWTPLTLSTVDILQGGWHADVHQRWTMSKIKSKLQEEVLRLKRMENEDTCINTHSNTAVSEPQLLLPKYNRRRSTFVVVSGNFGRCCSNQSQNDDDNNNDKRHRSIVGTTANGGRSINADATRSTTAASSIGLHQRAITAEGKTSILDEESPSVEF